MKLLAAGGKRALFVGLLGRRLRAGRGVPCPGKLSWATADSFCVWLSELLPAGCSQEHRTEGTWRARVGGKHVGIPYIEQSREFDILRTFIVPDCCPQSQNQRMRVTGRCSYLQRFPVIKSREHPCKIQEGGGTTAGTRGWLPSC